MPPGGRSAVRRVAIFGSTGSIGQSTLSVIRDKRDRFQVELLVAGERLDLLAEQTREFSPAVVAIKDRTRVPELREKLAHLPRPPEIAAGAAEIADLAASARYDVMVAAMVGISGLQSVCSALTAGRRVALANKESLVAAGRLVSELISAGKGELLPVDSEHSAIFQVLQSERREDICGLTLTASGGPFFGSTSEEIARATPEEAIRHPRWEMGRKVSVDSATMFNKALELVEAHWLFGVPASAIKVLIHPQSIVHSLLHLNVGSHARIFPYHLDEPAERHPPDRIGRFSEALSKNLASETDRELENSHTAQLGEKKVAELMHEYEDAE